MIKPNSKEFEKLKQDIINSLMPLNPDKIILFGSYAYGTPTEDSDIDLFLLKDDLEIDDTRKYEIDAMKRLLDIQLNNNTNGIDILSGPTEYIKKREDYFYKVDVLQNGQVWYDTGRKR